MRSSPRRKLHRSEKYKSRLLTAVIKSPLAFSISTGLLILGFAAGAALCESMDGGALATAFFERLEHASRINILRGFIISLLFSLTLASAILLMRVSIALLPLSCAALSVKGAALGFAFTAARISTGGLLMPLLGVLMPSLPMLTSLSFMLAGAFTYARAAEKNGLLSGLLPRDIALFILGVLSEGLCSQAIALFIDAAA